MILPLVSLKLIIAPLLTRHWANLQNKILNFWYRVYNDKTQFTQGSYFQAGPLKPPTE